MAYLSSIIALFIIASVAFLIVRVGAIALMMTGLPRETANFQAISAFFGVGYTTAEAELIIRHPVRRRIAQHLIVVGNLGITSALATFIIAVVGGGDKGGLSGSETIAILIGGVIALFLVLNFKPVRLASEWIIRRTLKSAGVIRPLDYDLMLRVEHGYAVSEVMVDAGSSLAGRSLAQSGLGARGVIVLGISREDGEYIGAPSGHDVIEAGDQLLLYGTEDDMRVIGAEARPSE